MNYTPLNPNATATLGANVAASVAPVSVLASVAGSQLRDCETCPIPPVSQAIYTRSRQASYGAPSVVSQVIDRCTGVPVSQTEQLTVTFTTGQWTLAPNSSVAPVYQSFVPGSFNTV